MENPLPAAPEPPTQILFGPSVLEPRFKRFFETRGWPDLTVEKQLNILLDLADARPALVHPNQKLPEKGRNGLYRSCRASGAQTFCEEDEEEDDEHRSPLEDPEDYMPTSEDCLSEDSDGSWDERPKYVNCTEMPWSKT